MKRLVLLLFIFGSVLVPAVAEASTGAICTVEPVTVTASGHVVTTPTVRLPCP
jgi:hypothetical protein